MEQPRKRHRRNAQEPPAPPDADVVDEVLLARQTEAYMLRTAGMTIAGIASHYGVSRAVANSYVAAETARRVEELKGSRMEHTALAIARYEGIIQRARNRISAMQARVAESEKGADRWAFLEEKIIMDAQKRIDRLLGLEAPRVVTPVDGDGKPLPPSQTFNVFPGVPMLSPLEQLAMLPPEQRAEVLERARRKRLGLPMPVQVESEPVTIEAEAN